MNIKKILLLSTMYACLFSGSSVHTLYYKAGTVTMSELLEAQSLYRQSRDKYVEAYTHYELKKREYLQLTGR